MKNKKIFTLTPFQNATNIVLLSQRKILMLLCFNFYKSAVETNQTKPNLQCGQAQHKNLKTIH